MPNLYLDRYAYPKKLIQQSPKTSLILTIVIPCYNEPDLIRSLESLKNCAKPSGNVEVIVVINNADNATKEVKSNNTKTFLEAREWASLNQQDWCSFHIFYEEDLLSKHAGVGLARKIGMDEAVRRFEAIDNHNNGIIACFDADCSCDTNYMVEIERFFLNKPKAPGCSIYYEHPLEGSFPDTIYKAIVDYELFLRYYEMGLAYAGFPYAYQTIGSSMAVRSSIYQKQGGMNKRKAGEDFYFLQKLMPLGDYDELTTTRTIPSPRISTRVPFGTGKAVGDWTQNLELLTYHPQIFEDLKFFLSRSNELYKKQTIETSSFIEKMPASISHFLTQQDFVNQLSEINRQSTNEATFKNRFFRWFNGFRVLKFVHFARDEYYNNVPIHEASKSLLQKSGLDEDIPNTSKAMLLLYRKICRDKNHSI